MLRRNSDNYNSKMVRNVKRNVHMNVEHIMHDQHFFQSNVETFEIVSTESRPAYMKAKAR